ncbi:MAG: deoxyribonuclease IV [Bacilli bacterium]|nr:deoxyribonuclease IV [Bacilli bacterium]
MILGCHVSFSNNQLLGSVEEALSYGANTFMFYTGAPQNTFRSSINMDYVESAWKLMIDNNINIDNVICHAPYIINLANATSLDKWQFSINFLKNEIKRCEDMHVKYMVLHPGSHVSLTREEGIKNIIDALNYIVKDDDKCMILLETMAGKGSECGITLEEIATILNGVKSKNIGVCLDTCHLNDAGYDMSKFDEFLQIFNNLIGIDRIKCVHVNDSKNVIGAHKDRHENIGIGTIGFDNLVNIVHNDKLKDVPKILETPYIGEDDDDKKRVYPPYKFEIEMLKNKTFDNDYLNKIRAYYK